MATLDEGIMVTPVHIAAKYDRRECLTILLEHGADANIPNSFGQTPLHIAARRKLPEMVKVSLLFVYSLPLACLLPIPQRCIACTIMKRHIFT